MASSTRVRQREEERRLSVRTLLIAAVASAAAAIITSKFWTAGTPIAAAITPVIVALVSELLHRPTEAIAERLTTDRTAVLPEAGGAAPPPPRDADPLPRQAPPEPDPGMTVYRQAPGRSRRRIAVGVVVTTALLAFAIAAAALTIPELIAGGSLGNDRDTTLFGGRDRDEPEQQQTPQPPVPQEQPTVTQPPETTPSETETSPPTETETAPTETAP